MFAALLNALSILQDRIHLLSELVYNVCDAVKLFTCLIDLLDALTDMFLLLLHDLKRVLNAVRILGDQPSDLLCGSFGLLGKLSDLLGNDSKSAALFSRTRCFNSGIEGEKVRLSRNLGDHFNNLRDALGTLVESRDRSGDILRTLI